MRDFCIFGGFYTCNRLVTFSKTCEGDFPNIKLGFFAYNQAWKRRGFQPGVKLPRISRVFTGFTLGVTLVTSWRTLWMDLGGGVPSNFAIFVIGRIFGGGLRGGKSLFPCSRVAYSWRSSDFSKILRIRDHSRSLPV